GAVAAALPPTGITHSIQHYEQTTPDKRSADPEAMAVATRSHCHRSRASLCDPGMKSILRSE
ncbi:MAG: hypothetical protein AAFX02_10330, partial [Pseudomonadota bacterium]